MNAGLRIENLTKSYGGIHALQEVNLECPCGNSIGIVGANGAGKTTLFNVISGLDQPDAGVVFFNGKDLTKQAIHCIAQAGIGRTFQKPRVFANLSLTVNLSLALNSPLANWRQSNSIPERNQVSVEDQVAATLDRFGLAEQAKSLAGELSFGQKKLLELARVWLCRPGAILLDEPSAGIHERLRPLLLDVIEELREQGASVVIVEHDIEFLLAAVSRVALMSEGRIEASLTGSGLDLRQIRERLGLW